MAFWERFLYCIAHCFKFQPIVTFIIYNIIIPDQSKKKKDCKYPTAKCQWIHNDILKYIVVNLERMTLKLSGF